MSLMVDEEPKEGARVADGRAWLKRIKMPRWRLAGKIDDEGQRML